MADRSSERHDQRASELEGVRRRLEALEHFPDQNPNPVLRMDADGVGALLARRAVARDGKNGASFVAIVDDLNRECGPDDAPTRGHRCHASSSPKSE